MRRGELLYPILVLGVILFGLASAQADMRTKPIRLVHEVTWAAQPGPISISGVNNSDHENAPEFFESMSGWIVKGLEKLKYTVQEDAPLEFRWTLDIYDPGSAAKRMAIGFGTGTAHVQGTVTVLREGEVAGKYEYSARPKMTGGAKQVGPILALKVHQGGKDEELHEYEKAAREAEAEER